MLFLLLLACSGSKPAPDDTGRDDSRPDDTSPDDSGDSGDSGGSGDSAHTGDSGDWGPPPADGLQDILTTDLQLDLAGLEGRATVVAWPAVAGPEVRLDVSGLEVTALEVDGHTITPEVRDGWLVTGVPDADAPVTLVVDYRFEAHENGAFDGWIPDLGVTFVWPYFCGNLYPCDPAMRDGVTFTMGVTGVEDGLTAVYPESTWSDAPSYMPAVSVGDYTRLDLGTTDAGTHLSAWYLPGERGEEDARAGTAHLLGAYDFYEHTYGPYAFGPESGPVEVDWGVGSWGGMEHHPYFHVAQFDFATEEVHAHEAAHAWFGDAVRLGCWEDFVLSEGTVTYMAARAMEETGGPDLWAYYVDDFLIPICGGMGPNPVVYPDGCNEIDLLEDDIWSLATYMKGACFYEEVADAIGTDAVDETVGAYYRAHQNSTGHMSEMIDALAERAGADKRALVESAAQDWLYTAACPTDYAPRCKAHQAAR